MNDDKLRKALRDRHMVAVTPEILTLTAKAMGWQILDLSDPLCVMFQSNGPPRPIDGQLVLPD